MEGWELKEDKLISVIVPVYNAEKTLARCLESIQRQTYTNWEAVLVDDGSEDNSSSLCKRYADIDRRFSLIHQAHCGIGSARNAGIRNSAGAYIAFADADDYAEPQMLEKLYRQILESGADIVACGYYLEKGKSRFIATKQTGKAHLDGDEAMTAAMQRNYFQGFLWNKLFDAHLFLPKEDPWFSEKLSVCEDLVFLTNCFIQNAKIFYYADPLYHYCIQSESLTQTSTPGRLSELNARREIIGIIPEKNTSALQMARCKYSETAANLKYIAITQKNRKWAEYYTKEAKRYAKIYYQNPQLYFMEKGKFFLKQHAPRITARMISIYHTIRFFFCKKQ